MGNYPPPVPTDLPPVIDRLVRKALALDRIILPDALGINWAANLRFIDSASQQRRFCQLPKCRASRPGPLAHKLKAQAAVQQEERTDPMEVPSGLTSLEHSSEMFASSDR